MEAEVFCCRIFTQYSCGRFLIVLIKHKNPPVHGTGGFIVF